MLSSVLEVARLSRQRSRVRVSPILRQLRSVDGPEFIARPENRRGLACRASTAFDDEDRFVVDKVSVTILAESVIILDGLLQESGTDLLW